MGHEDVLKEKKLRNGSWWLGEKEDGCYLRDLKQRKNNSVGCNQWENYSNL